MTYERNYQRGNNVWRSKDEPLLNHANTGDNAGGVGSSYDVALAGSWAVETGKQTTG